MATQYPSDRPSRGQSSRYAQTGARPAGTRPANGAGRPSGARPAGSTARPSAARPGSRPAGARPAGNSAPNRRPPQRRRKKPQGRFYAIIAVAVLLIVALVLIFTRVLGGSKDPVVPTPTAVPQTTETAAPLEGEPAEAADTSHADALAAMLGNQDQAVDGLSSDEMAQVSDLSINESLSEDWMNVLLLGSDERTLSESARTDSMIICSINLKTGEVKLTSIMRDLAVHFDDIGKYNGTYRINSANFFGGEKLAMKTVNECFGMNIEKYVRVNFYGFQQIAQILGGVEMDITEAEMNMINELILQQWRLARANGIDESNLPNQKLETYGEGTPLDARQTLAYARIRKLDGGDYERANRQRKVLVALMEKLKGAGMAELLQLGTAAMEHMKTNMSLDEILAVAMTVLNNGMTSVESFRLPVNDSYVQERRNEQEMFYDCDWSKNSLELYNFIYG